MKAGTRYAVLIAVVAVLFGSPWWYSRTVRAQATATPASSALPEILSEAEETRLALSAAPQHLKAGAGVYVLTAAGYRLTRASTNRFTCIVNRDHPRALKPTCFDEEGTAAIIPKIVRVGELMLKGKSLAEISADIRDGFATGRFRSPAPGRRLHDVG